MRLHLVTLVSSFPNIDFKEELFELKKAETSSLRGVFSMNRIEVRKEIGKEKRINVFDKIRQLE